MLCQALCIISEPLVESHWSYSPEMPNSGQNRTFFVPCDLKIWQMTLKNNRVPLLCYIKVCASFHSHQRFQAGVTVWKCSLRVKILNFLSCVTLKFDGWPWKTMGHLSYATSSFVYHYITIYEFKIELQSRNGWTGFWPLWLWPLTSDLDLLHGHHCCQL